MANICSISTYHDFAAAGADNLAGELGDWAAKLGGEFEQEYFARLQTFIKNEASGNALIFPPACEVFSAFKLTSPNDVRVVIIGQDPYHGAGQAHGLAFSVKRGIAVPKSLQNIYKELANDVGGTASEHAAHNIRSRDGCLEDWASQGVLLLNTVLTVRSGDAGSHRGRGWETFTDNVLKVIDCIDRPIAFVLWGNDARRKKAFISNPNRLIVESAHPSPLSAHRGFFGSRPFSRINEFLKSNGAEPIVWR